MLSRIIESMQVAGAENNFLEGCMRPAGSMLVSPDIEYVYIMFYLYNAGNEYKTS
jgi:hypothetical protein